MNPHTIRRRLTNSLSILVGVLLALTVQSVRGEVQEASRQTVEVVELPSSVFTYFDPTRPGRLVTFSGIYEDELTIVGYEDNGSKEIYRHRISPPNADVRFRANGWFLAPQDDEFWMFCAYEPGLWRFKTDGTCWNDGQSILTGELAKHPIVGVLPLSDERLSVMVFFQSKNLVALDQENAVRARRSFFDLAIVDSKLRMNDGAWISHSSFYFSAEPGEEMRYYRYYVIGGTENERKIVEKTENETPITFSHSESNTTGHWIYDRRNGKILKLNNDGTSALFHPPLLKKNSNSTVRIHPKNRMFVVSDPHSQITNVHFDNGAGTFEISELLNGRRAIFASVEEADDPAIFVFAENTLHFLDWDDGKFLNLQVAAPKGLGAVETVLFSGFSEAGTGWVAINELNGNTTLCSIVRSDDQVSLESSVRVDNDSITRVQLFHGSRFGIATLKEGGVKLFDRKCISATGDHVILDGIRFQNSPEQQPIRGLFLRSVSRSFIVSVPDESTIDPNEIRVSIDGADISNGARLSVPEFDELVVDFSFEDEAINSDKEGVVQVIAKDERGEELASSKAFSKVGSLVLRSPRDGLSKCRRLEVVYNGVRGYRAIGLDVELIREGESTRLAKSTLIGVIAGLFLAGIAWVSPGESTFARWAPALVTISSVLFGGVAKFLLSFDFDPLAVSGGFGLTLVAVFLFALWNPRVFRTLLKTIPFDMIAATFANSRRVRSCLYSDLISYLRHNLDAKKQESMHEQYFPIPGQIDKSPTETEFVADPVDYLFSEIINNGDACVLIEGPGGTGKSAIARELASRLVDAANRGEPVPLPIFLNAVSDDLIDDVFSALKPFATTRSFTETQIANKHFAIILDGITENASIGPDFFEHFRRTGLAGKLTFIATLRSNRAYINSARQALSATILRTRGLVDSEALDAFQSAYKKSDAKSKIVTRVIPAQFADHYKSPAGFYIPIAVRLAMFCSTELSLGEVYEATLDRLLVRDEARKECEALCLETYWVTGRRTFVVPREREQLCDELIQAGLLNVPQESVSKRKKVRFFHDSLQSYLTACALSDKDDLSVLREGVSAERFQASPSGIILENSTEAFEMCLLVFDQQRLSDFFYAQIGADSVQNADCFSIAGIQTAMSSAGAAVGEVDATNKNPYGYLTDCVANARHSSELPVLAALYVYVVKACDARARDALVLVLHV